MKRRDFLKGSLLATTLPLMSSEGKKESETLKFIHITDSHFDLNIEDSVDAMILAVKHINKNYKDLDFVLFGGDNFNNNVKGSKDAKDFKAIVDKLNMPSYFVRGNKESFPKPNDSLHLAEFKEMFMSSKDIEVVGKDWVFEKKGYKILGLDSCVENANNGLYTKDTINFAKTQLEKGKPTIILNHHPYTNYWKEKDEKLIHKYVLNNTDEVQKEIFGYQNFILALSGHKHIDFVSHINKTNVIVTRGFIRPLDLDMYPMRYVEITDNKITEKLIYTA